MEEKNDNTNNEHDNNDNERNETDINNLEDELSTEEVNTENIIENSSDSEAINNNDVASDNLNDEVNEQITEELSEATNDHNEFDEQFEDEDGEQIDDSEPQDPAIETDEIRHKHTTRLKKEMLLGASVLVIVFIIVLAVVLFFSRGSSNYKKTITKTQFGKITQEELYQYYRVNNSNDVIVDLIINQVLLNNFAPSNEELEKEFESKKSPYKNNSDFKNYIISLGFLTEDAYKQDLALQLARDNFSNSLKVTDEEIAEYYNNEITDTHYVSHILLDSEATAVEVKEKLNAGEDFSALAEQYSQDDSSKESGGDIGDISSLQLPEKFLTAANSLNENEISEPVNTEYGFHIIKVTKVEPKKTLEELKDDIEKTLIQQKSSTSLVDLLKKAKPITYEDKFFDQKIEEILEQFE